MRLRTLHFVLLSFLTPVLSAQSTAISFSPERPASGPQPVAFTITGASPCSPSLTGVYITGKTIAIEAGCGGLIPAAPNFFELKGSFTPPPYPGVYQVEFWLTLGGTTRLLLGSRSLAFRASIVCDLGDSLTAEPSTIRVGEAIELAWCDPSYSAVQTVYQVGSYSIYSARSLNGPYMKVMDVQGPTKTAVSIPTTTAGSFYYYVEAHGCAALNQFCSPNSPDVTRLSNIAAVSVVSSTACLPSATTLCLQNGRFSATARFWTTEAKSVTSAHAVPLTDQSGYFWFFSKDNVEVTMKALNACPASFWVFASGMTNVGVDITVIDTQRGSSRTYSDVLGKPFATILDTSAFPCP